jgi:hypothetical protein
LEPFITPALYQKYPRAIDEWTLHTLMAADTAGGGINQIEEHYKTFIVRLLSFAHAIAIVNAGGTPDRGRLCSDRWRRTQLDTPAYPILGYRYLAWRTFPSQGLLEVCPQGIQLGTEVWPPDYARYSHRPRLAKRVRIPHQCLCRVIDGRLSRYNHSGQSGKVNVLNGVMVSTAFNVYRKVIL